jgi:hypothetical protein
MSAWVIGGLIGAVAFGLAAIFALSTGHASDLLLRGIGDGDREERPDTFWFLTMIYFLAAAACAVTALVSYLRSA